MGGWLCYPVDPNSIGVRPLRRNNTHHSNTPIRPPPTSFQWIRRMFSLWSQAKPAPAPVSLKDSALKESKLLVQYFFASTIQLIPMSLHYQPEDAGKEEASWFRLLDSYWMSSYQARKTLRFYTLCFLNSSGDHILAKSSKLGHFANPFCFVCFLLHRHNQTLPTVQTHELCYHLSLTQPRSKSSEQYTDC